MWPGIEGGFCEPGPALDAMTPGAGLLALGLPLSLPVGLVLPAQ